MPRSPNSSPCLTRNPGPSAAEAGPAVLRPEVEARAARRPTGPAMHVVRDVVVSPGETPARLYRSVAEPTSLVGYPHGGVWVIRNVGTHDRACRRFAAASGLSVLSLEYR